jgi:hypothetical protein
MRDLCACVFPSKAPIPFKKTTPVTEASRIDWIAGQTKRAVSV